MAERVDDESDENAAAIMTIENAHATSRGQSLHDSSNDHHHLVSTDRGLADRRALRAKSLIGQLLHFRLERRGLRRRDKLYSYRLAASVERFSTIAAVSFPPMRLSKTVCPTTLYPAAATSASSF